MKRIILIAACLVFLSGCSSGRSADELESLVNLAATTGAIDAFTYDSSYGPQTTWCLSRADDYIATVMGFDGSNGDEDMGTVSAAYFRACMDY
jgi:hypothetical protein